MSVPKFNAIYPYENSEIIMVIRICVLGNTITKVIFELAEIAQIIITIYSNLISQFVINI